MLKLKKVSICLVLSIALIAMNLLPVMAEVRAVVPSKNVSDISNQKGYTLSWKNIQGGKVLEKVTISEDDYIYAYNENQSRISKIYKEDTIIYEYNNERMIISEDRGNYKFEYHYDSLNSIAGFTLNNIIYKYVKDDDLNIVAITDEQDNYLVKYEYNKNGIVSAILGKDDTGKWVNMSKESSFIGTLNLIRLHSYYYDIETGWYYNGYQYYDSVNNKYIGGNDNLKDISTQLLQ